MKHQVFNRIITISRKDLTPGAQNAQLLHSLAQFSLDFPEKFKSWNNGNIVSLSARDEQQLGNLLLKLEENDIAASAFYEPDIKNQLTSICIEGTEKASKLTSSFPLSFKEYNGLVASSCLSKHSFTQ